MTPAALALALASALLHAGWNALLKRARDLEAASSALFLVAVLASGAAALALPGPAFPTRAALGWALAAGLAEGAYFVALVASLSRGGLGWAYAWMRGAAVLIAWPLGLLALNEPLGAAGAAGVAGVLAGLVLLGGGDRGGKGGVPWALAAGAAIAGANASYKAALAAGAAPAALFTLAMAVGLPLQAAVRALRGGAVLAWPERPGLAVLAGLLCAASFLLLLGALARGGSAEVLTVRNVSVVFAVLLGRAGGERPGLRVWAGALLVALGAAVLGARG